MRMWGDLVISRKLGPVDEHFGLRRISYKASKLGTFWKIRIVPPNQLPCLDHLHRIQPQSTLCESGGRRSDQRRGNEEQLFQRMTPRLSRRVRLAPRG